MSLFSNLIITIIAADYSKRKSILPSNSVPKQYLKSITNQNTILQDSVIRSLKFIASENIIIIELNEYQNMLSENLNNIFDINKNVILEPCLQNNGISTILSAIHAKETYNTDSHFLITNAGHLIKEEEKFEQILRYCITNMNKDSIISFGIQDKDLLNQNNFSFLVTENSDSKSEFQKVINISDKSIKKAKKSQKLFVDSGIYITSTDFIIEKAKKHFSALYNKIYEAYKKSHLFEDMIYLNYKDYQEITNLPLRKILLEEMENFFVIPMDAGWSPVSSLDISLNYNNENNDYPDLKEEENEFFVNEHKEFYYSRE